MENNMTPNYNNTPVNNAPYNSAPDGTLYIPPEYQPISMWGYFGYQILFAIPFIGLIALIILSFGAKNKNVMNFARSYFCFIILILIFASILMVTGIGASVLSSMY